MPRDTPSFIITGDPNNGENSSNKPATKPDEDAVNPKENKEDVEPSPAKDESSEPVKPPRGLVGRDYREQPAFRPILDSNVELFEPNSREPVRVENAFVRMLWHQFMLPIALFILAIAGVYGIYVFFANYEEKQLQREAEVAMSDQHVPIMPNPGLAATDRAVIRSNPFTNFSAGDEAEIAVVKPAPAQEAYCRAAENVVTEFLNAESLEMKLQFVTQPDVLRRDFLARYPAMKAGHISHRRLQCLGLVPNATVETYVVEVTLFNFSQRYYQVRNVDRQMEIHILNPEAFLE